MYSIKVLVVSIAALSTLVPVASSAPQKCHCVASDSSCWPSSEEWDTFNNTIAGRLIAPKPTVMSTCTSAAEVEERIPHDRGQPNLRADGSSKVAPLRTPKKEEIYDEVKVRHALSPLIDVQELKWVDVDVLLRVTGTPVAKRPRRPTAAQLHRSQPHVTGTLHGAPICVSKCTMQDLHIVLKEDDNAGYADRRFPEEYAFFKSIEKFLENKSVVQD